MRVRAAGRILRQQGGFSLTELLTAMIVMGVVLAAAYAIWFGLQRTYGFVDEDLKAQAEARGAMAEMMELIRTSREPQETVPEDMDLVIVRAEPNMLVCWTDTDRDENHDLELVRFRVDVDGENEQSLFRDTCDVVNYGAISLADLDSEATLTRLVGKWVSNSDDPSEWLFNYVGMNGAALDMSVDGEGELYIADPTQIREVHILLKVDVILGKSPEYHELSGVVQPRNLRSY